MVAALVGDLISWVSVVALTVVALTITVVVALRMYRRLKARSHGAGTQRVAPL